MASDDLAPQINLNLNVRGLGHSATLAINEKSKRLQSEGRHVYRLGLGQSPFPVPRPVVDELRANAHQKDYLDVVGLPVLRDAVANYYLRRYGVSRTADEVLIGPGSKELMFLVQLVYYGELVIPTPSWVSYAPQAHIIGRKVHWVPTTVEHGWPLRPEELDAVCREDPSRPRLVILNYPSNPTGQTYDIDALQKLAEVARRYRVILLSDEIYGELDHQGRHASIATFYPEGTIISGGLSKWCGAGGWRLGTFTFPSELTWLRDAVAAVASETYTSTSAPIQFAAVKAFDGGNELEGYLVNARRILRALGVAFAERLRSAGVFVPDPQGAFYLFPDFSALGAGLAERGVQTSTDLCERLLGDTGVALLPGSAFGRSPHELTARLAYVDFDGAQALAAAEAIPRDQELDAAFLDQYCANTIRAAEVIADWIAD
ncbi:MAG TPA: aminotransferase class I/II-fold pyridoxal phosphate-dependent enzyme [Acidimicrobiia bacterium]|nr:aminotransferase class I/II-fold pyridoxal phosphate-dependent enzyme [Acidimicrobiia bacterium]